MTAEFGPQNADLSLTERVAARSMKHFVAGVDALTDEQGLRFKESNATLSITGVSEQSGDGFGRGKFAAITVFANMLLPLLPLTILAEFGAQAALPTMPLLASVYVSTVVLPLGVFSLVNAIASLSLLHKINVIDHTTPKPDERVGELEQRYIDGDLDREEFEHEVETVFERESGR